MAGQPHAPNPTNLTQIEIVEAVANGDAAQLKLLLNGISRRPRSVVLNTTELHGRPLIVHAAAAGYAEIVASLLDSGASPLVPAYATGRTALHEAVHGGHVDVAKALLGQDMDDKDEELASKQKSVAGIPGLIDSMTSMASTINIVNSKDQVGLTPLLLLADSPAIARDDFDTLTKLLIDAGANAKVAHPATGQTALFRAVELRAVAAAKSLLWAGTPVEAQDNVGDTAGHVAARLDKAEILWTILKHSSEGVNIKNNRGETAMHCAAIGGSRQCLYILLNFGGDLSVEDNEYNTGIDTIFAHVPRPTSFLIDVFNLKIMTNGCAINDRKFQLTLDFRVLSPDRSRQMDVLVALMNTFHSVDRKRVLSHPLIETFLRAKWLRMRIFFFCLSAIHLIFVVSLSAYVAYTAYPNAIELIWSRRVLLSTATLLFGHQIIQIILEPRYFLKEPETWLSMVSVTLAFVLSLTGEFVHAPSNVDWMRHLSAYTILMAWAQIMYILGRFPAIGFFALMFFTVLKNVMKVLVISACLVIGFALSFSIQFNNFEYDGPLRAIIRTAVMLMGEYEYEENFPSSSSKDEHLLNRMKWDGLPIHLPVTSQLIFVAFMLLGSVVLVNLMIGLAVSDIQGLQAEGNLRHMIKQAEFLLHMDTILSRSRFFKKRKSTPSMVTISPNGTNAMKQSQYRRLGLNIPFEVMEGLIRIGLENQRKGGEHDWEMAQFASQPIEGTCSCGAVRQSTAFN